MAIYTLEGISQSCDKVAGEPILHYVYETRAAEGQMRRLLHRHSNMMHVVFIKEGRCLCRIDGQQYVAGRGNVFIVNAGLVHGTEILSEDAAHLIGLAFSGIQVADLPPNHMVPEGIAALVSRESLEREFAVLFGLVCRQAKEGGASSGQLCRHVLESLIQLILIETEKGEALDTARQELVHAMRDYIDDHYQDSLTLGSVADAFYINSYYASHIFKEVTGESLIQYLTQRRIGEAQTLLLFTEDSVTHVAAQVGYDNPNYFSTVFTKLVGISPVQYRAACRAEGE